MLDTRVKERLTGAIILVALLVLLVPELLSGPDSSAGTAAPASADGQQMRSYTIDLADDGAARRAAAVPVAPAPTAPVPESSPAAQPNGATTDTQRDVSGATADDVTGAAGTAGPVAGPAVTASEPPAGEPSIAGRLGGGDSGIASASSAVPPRALAPTPSRVVSAERAAAASAERTAGSGWAVQVGSFASRENADRLARELRGKGFASHVSESSGKGKRLWRVRVGPAPDRAGAVALGARLRATGQSGSIVPMQ